MAAPPFTATHLFNRGKGFDAFSLGSVFLKKLKRSIWTQVFHTFSDKEDNSQ
jgi:hypothetical protein